MPFPDVTFPPGTDHQSLLDKLQKWTQGARNYWLNLPERKTVTAADAPGRPGQIHYDDNYLYFCVASGDWRRISLTW